MTIQKDVAKINNNVIILKEKWPLIPPGCFTGYVIDTASGKFPPKYPTVHGRG